MMGIIMNQRGRPFGEGFVKDLSHEPFTDDHDVAQLRVETRVSQTRKTKQSMSKVIGAKMIWCEDGRKKMAHFKQGK